jgi:Protein of unknown function (DUF3892)
MMKTWLVTGANVEHRGDPSHEHITHLCGRGPQWTYSVGDVLTMIWSKQHQFIVRIVGEPDTDVLAVQPKDGRKPYVTTARDASMKNNLLRLPPCSP